MNKDVECLPQHLVTKCSILVLESVLNETWKNESDDEWAQYLSA